jgi:hypothetical protein
MGCQVTNKDTSSVRKTTDTMTTPSETRGDIVLPASMNAGNSTDA